MMNSALTLPVRPLPAGREYAEKLAKQYGMRDPEKLAKQLGLNVDYPDMPQNAERVLFAEFRERTTSTSIWTASAKAALC